MNTTTLPFRYSPRALRFAAIALTLTPLARSTLAPDRWATLEAIHQLENPHNRPTPGPCGELGPYQFRATTWQMHTTIPFARAIDRRKSDDVAIKHYEWLKRGLEVSGLPATTYNIALAWNSGLNAAVFGRAPAVVRDYAERVANLAGSFGAARVTNAAEPAARVNRLGGAKAAESAMIRLTGPTPDEASPAPTRVQFKPFVSRVADSIARRDQQYAREPKARSGTEPRTVPSPWPPLRFRPFSQLSYIRPTPDRGILSKVKLNVTV